MASNLKILIIDTYYPAFIKKIESDENFLKRKKYREQLSFFLDKKFGTADYYSKNLNLLGCQAQDIIVNNKITQHQWAKENSILIFPMFEKLNHFWIIWQQIKKIHPDVVYCQDLSFINPFFLKNFKKYCRLLVGQIASPLPPKNYYQQFDLILTSFPHYVSKFKKQGINSEYFKIGFEETLLSEIKTHQKKYDVIFIGGFEKVHLNSIALLEAVAQKFDLKIWGYGMQNVPIDSILHKCYQGEAWGLEMYKIIAESKICINRHSSAAERYANNMRLYEVTGMGTLLITDYKDNLNDLFKINEEIVAYHNQKELLDKINFYLTDDQEREKIAKNGRLRTLHDHTYKIRMKELKKILNNYL